MTNPRWLNDEEQSLWRLMLAVNRKVSRGIDETLQLGSGLTSSEFAVLVNLSESPDHIIRLRDLCVSLNWDRSRTSHQIIRMEKRGLVVKKRCPDDGRGVYVQLTREGKNAYDLLRLVMWRWLGNWFLILWDQDMWQPYVITLKRSWLSILTRIKWINPGFFRGIPDAKVPVFAAL